MYQRPEVCVLPVAGLSTRNLPTTKVLHKGFLTLDSLPIIQYAVDCCAEAGVKEIVFIYSNESCKYLYEQYYSPAPTLENHLKEHGKTDLLQILNSIIPNGMHFSFALQEKPLGNGHAVLMAKDIIGSRPFIVMWPDDVYINFNGPCVLKELCEVYEKTGGVVENIMEFPKEEMTRYGALIGATQNGNLVSATGLIEKPKLEEVPSNFASMGPYILPNSVMQALPTVQKGGNGEINLTDAINLSVKQGEKLTGVLTHSTRFDCGTNSDLAKANITLSLMRHKDLRQTARSVLEKFKNE